MLNMGFKINIDRDRTFLYTQLVGSVIINLVADTMTLKFLPMVIFVALPLSG
jgi:hypothetical protein